MFCSSEFPAAVFQQVEELFCVVAVVDGVVEFGSDRDFYQIGAVAQAEAVAVGE